MCHLILNQQIFLMLSSSTLQRPVLLVMLVFCHNTFISLKVVWLLCWISLNFSKSLLNLHQSLHVPIVLLCTNALVVLIDQGGWVLFDRHIVLDSVVTVTMLLRTLVLILMSELRYRAILEVTYGARVTDQIRFVIYIFPITFLLVKIGRWLSHGVIQ